mmetsp:Transcript_1853/g.5240  ORF Transcript_1853/g.5240 Transcript_1853/m.5240 type:complete len:327 (+) Transcript_1853:160-1140(+)
MFFCRCAAAACALVVCAFGGWTLIHSGGGEQAPDLQAQKHQSLAVAVDASSARALAKRPRAVRAQGGQTRARVLACSVACLLCPRSAKPRQPRPARPRASGAALQPRRRSSLLLGPACGVRGPVRRRHRAVRDHVRPEPRRREAAGRGVARASVRRGGRRRGGGGQRVDVPRGLRHAAAPRAADRPTVGVLRRRGRGRDARAPLGRGRGRRRRVRQRRQGARGFAGAGTRQRDAAPAPRGGLRDQPQEGPRGRDGRAVARGPGDGPGQAPADGGPGRAVDGLAVEQRVAVVDWRRPRRDGRAAGVRARVFGGRGPHDRGRQGRVRD